MSKAHKMAKRMQRIEDTHRRDMVALKKELLDAVGHMLDEANGPLPGEVVGPFCGRCCVYHSTETPPHMWPYTTTTGLSA